LNTAEEAYRRPVTDRPAWIERAAARRRERFIIFASLI
jgi:hypothetical protein